MIITNAKIVTPEKIIHGDIVIDSSGKVSQIYSSSEAQAESRSSSPQGRTITSEVFDAKGRYVMPGLIEVHGHMREPGLTQKEDVPHGTAAAVAGGFTTIIDMPNTNPPTTTVSLLRDKIAAIYPGRSHADYAFFFGVSKDNLSELETVKSEDIVGFKVFMAGHETTPTTIPDDETLSKVFAIAAKRNILLAVHAEDQFLINQLDETLKKTGRTDAKLWSELRPASVVSRAVERALKLQETYKTTLYLLHLSTPEEFRLVKQAKEKGQKVYGELVSYQLNFNTNDYATIGNKIKVSPALRSPEVQAELWKLLRSVLTSGVAKRAPARWRNPGLDVLCSEHTPHEWETKNQDNVWQAQSGMPNIQETLPAVITNWLKRDLVGRTHKTYEVKSLEACLMTIAKVSSENPAHIFGFTTKGKIEPGKDADLVILDTQNEWTVKKEDILSKCGWSAYEGMNLIGRPTTTFLRGKMVYNNGEIVDKPQGLWLH